MDRMTQPADPQLARECPVCGEPYDSVEARAEEIDSSGLFRVTGAVSYTYKPCGHTELV
jgi:hypothetical protein